MKKKIISVILSAAALSLLAVPLDAGAASASSQAGTVATASGGLNVRAAASESSSVITSLYKGSYVTLMRRAGEWWYVEFDDGKFGWCRSDYIQYVSSTARTVNVSWGTLNVRNGAGTSYRRIASLNRGDIVLELSSAGGWSRILYNGTDIGFVKSSYLASAGSRTAVSLSVPHFMQTDSRWAGVTLGSSGKTISRVGCTTTSIAMIESYRTGKTLYPDAMSKKLKYTSSGNVYWPADYVAVTDRSGYLEVIYAQLKAGKPVLFGAKKASGGQHWVVITGCKSGSSLSASDLTINDPADRSRTTLADLFEDYPYFYKFFYYQG